MVHIRVVGHKTFQHVEMPTALAVDPSEPLVQQGSVPETERGQEPIDEHGDGQDECRQVAPLVLDRGGNPSKRIKEHGINVPHGIHGR